MPQVTGIGGVFIKSKGDPKALTAWYQENLGIKINPWGSAVFRWFEDPEKEKGATAWCVAAKDSAMFKSTESSFIINYRVDDLEGLVANLRLDIVLLTGQRLHVHVLPVVQLVEIVEETPPPLVDNLFDSHGGLTFAL